MTNNDVVSPYSVLSDKAKTISPDDLLQQWPIQAEGRQYYPIGYLNEEQILFLCKFR